MSRTNKNAETRPGRINTDAAFRCFLRRVWQEDVTPLLRGQRAGQRRAAARFGGRLAASAGLALDGLLGLRGRPFTRFLTVMGSTAGAILPDVWDWEWIQTRANADTRRVIGEQVRRRAAELADAEALALFGLTPQGSREALQAAWRAAAKRWHPDTARGRADQAECHVRFVAYSAAYERLCRAFDEGRLPLRRNK